MPCERRFAVMAPGARTWQILQTCVRGLAAAGHTPQVTVLGLEQEPRPEGAFPFEVVVPLDDSPSGPICNVRYVPLTFEPFMALADENGGGGALPDEVDAVVGTASAQPCATAAALATRLGVPLWVDFFGDPFAEIQTKAELSPEARGENDTRTHHVWKLHLASLLRGDAFSALSRRQRHAVIGQLGAAGRLNRHTAGTDLVAAIPFALFPPDVPPGTDGGRLPGGDFTAMWCGSFNTWMDVDALVGGIAGAVTRNPRVRLMVVGGAIPNYHGDGFGQFQEGIRDAGIAHAVDIVGWQPLGEMRRLYERCCVGLNVDRYSYEALLGSRTRIVQFVAAGLPVISTVVTELSEELRDAGLLLPFQLGDAASLTGALLDAAGRQSELAENARRGREFVLEHYGGADAGSALAAWVAAPRFAPDKDAEGRNAGENPLVEFWRGAEGTT